MSFKIKHPTNSKMVAIYGWGPHRGYHAEVWSGSQVLELYGQGLGGYTGLGGLLQMLIRSGFFLTEQVEAAHHALQFMEADEADEDLRRAAKVIENLRDDANAD